MVGTTLARSLDGLLQERGRLATKTQELAKTERMVIERLSQGLSGIGYRVVPNTGDGLPLKKTGRMARKRLRCPTCDRRFSHPLPMARHMVATHGAKKIARKPKTTKK